MTIKQLTTKNKDYTFSCNSIYLIKEKDLIDLLITAGQGISYWGEVYVNFEPNKPYEKGFLKIEREGGIYINTNNLNLESKLFCLDYQCYEIEDKSEIEIIKDKTIEDFINTIKLIIENPNTRGELKVRIIEALASADYGILDASDLDYIMQKCIFGSCVYG
jgi:hypothetical protein|tara:strand:- start:575 stop:1060 length:486 start_codon:yes stop_codon:yes gene_type:complete